MRALRDRPAAEGHLAAVGRRDRRPPSARRRWRRPSTSLAVQPVFTAHPTEASRRSVLLKLRALSDILAVLTPAGSAARARQDRKLAEIIDLIWQTDELRQIRPTPGRRGAQCAVLPGADRRRHHSGADRRPRGGDGRARRRAVPGGDAAAARAAGSVATGTATRTSRPRSPTRCSQLQHLTAIKIAIAKIDDLLMALSSSTAIVGVSDELLASIEVDLDHLPLLDPRVKELNSEEPIRLKLTCVKAKLINTRARVTADRPHEPGRDYVSRGELLADLAIVRRSLLANGGELAANGMLATVQRTLAVSGLNTAYMDIREHSEAHHQVLAQLVDRLGEQDRPYNDFSRAERRDLLSAELTSHRPLTSLPAPLDAAGTKTFSVFSEIKDAQADLRSRGDRHLHHLDDDGLRRHPGRRGAGQGGRAARHLRHAGRPGSRPVREHRFRAAAGDRRRAAQVRRGGRRAAQRPDLPGDRPAPRQRPGGHARVLRLQQAVRHHHQPVGDPQDRAAAARPGGRGTVCR